MEEQTLTYKLLLASNVDEVSQPVAMGEMNQFQVNVWIESTASLTFPVVATVQTSPDLDNWTDTTQTVTLGTAPSSDTATSPSTSFVGSPYLRMRYVGGGEDVLLGASIRLFKN